MRDQKVWSLPKFERLHIGGWGMKFHKQHCNMFQATLKDRQIKRMAIFSVENNRTYTSEAANQFSDWRRTNSCPILNERVCEVIPHLWLSWPSTCKFLEFAPYMLLLTFFEEYIRLFTSTPDNQNAATRIFFAVLTVKFTPIARTKRNVL